jgi:hypothetical protein
VDAPRIRQRPGIGHRRPEGREVVRVEHRGCLGEAEVV